MKKKTIFLTLAIFFLIIGLAAMGGQSTTASIIQGLSKGLAGTSFILFFIFMLLEKQPTDKSTH